MLDREPSEIEMLLPFHAAGTLSSRDARRVAREIVAAAEDGELFLYPGDQHYFADSSLPSYDADATALLTERVLAFLARV